MALLLNYLLCLALFASICKTAPVSGGVTVSVGPLMSVEHGGRVTLPCWIGPSQSAEDMEVRWYRGDFDRPVMLYKEKIFQTQSQEPSFAGRVSFGKKDGTSAGLVTGDVSLTFVNVTIKDTGNYSCYVSSPDGHDSSTLSLLVMETGESPILSPVWIKDGKVNVSCESAGWFPRPELHWADKIKNIKPESIAYHTVASGHFSVHSWILASESSELSCSVRFSSTMAKQATVRLVKTAEKEPEFNAGGWVAFGILLAIALIGLGVFYFKKKGKKSPSTEETTSLLPKEAVLPTPLLTAMRHYDNIQLENTNSEYLKVKGNILREDSPEKPYPDGTNVTCLTAIRGTQSFSGGKHYWEVSLKPSNIEAKKSWWIGVTSATEIPQEINFCPNASNGFWFLSSSPNKDNTLQFSTKPEIFLPCQSAVKTVGVFVDYDRGEISFYDVDDKALILSLTAEFTTEVFPLFNPGKGDQATMTILQKAEKSGEETTP